MPLLSFLKLIRFNNLMMIFLTQFLVKYFLFDPFNISITLNAFGFGLLVFSMMALAAAGNIINDIHDFETDAINKPQRQIIGKSISEKTAYNWFFGLNILGVGIGFYLANLVGHPGFVALFILPSVFLYLYATQLKRTVLVGNIVVSIMVAMIIVMIGIFELLPAITPENRLTQRTLFSILVDYGIFAFLVNLLREMVKDLEDIKGDYNAGLHTLPVVIGRIRTNKIIFVVAILPVAGVVYYIYSYLFENLWAVVYALLLILGPLLYFWIRILTAKTSKDYSHLSLLLKIVLAAGILSIGLYRFILL